MIGPESAGSSIWLPTFMISPVRYIGLHILYYRQQKLPDPITFTVGRIKWDLAKRRRKTKSNISHTQDKTEEGALLSMSWAHLNYPGKFWQAPLPKSSPAL